jgi:hypothetical protein
MRGRSSGAFLHDGCPVACLGDAPFSYVNVFTSHVNVGFFHGAALPDPAHLLPGTGKRHMRHVALRPGTIFKLRSAMQADQHGVFGYKGARRKRLAHITVATATDGTPIRDSNRDGEGQQAGRR